jgi:hypothetical protein
VRGASILGESVVKSKIAWSILRTVILCSLLFAGMSLFRNPHPPSFDSFGDFPFGEGNAPNHVRGEVLAQLADFQLGYAERDLEKADAFADRLISQANSLVLGTMPREVFIGHPASTQLIRDDWAYWGDCTFFLEGAHVSSNGDVAWIATIGFVEFDLSRFLVLPLRLTGVLANEEGTWRFQQLQYQFDLDLTVSLLLVVLLLLLTAGSAVVLLTQVSRGLFGRRAASTQSL